MKSPLDDGGWHEFGDVLSTQDLAAHALREGSGGVFWAANQTVGRGRLGRDWVSSPGDSLTMSMTFRSYADHPRPYLIGMTVAVAAAAVVRCEIAWPNDLVAEGKKIGGVLTELVKDEAGRSVAVVGVGINLNQKEFPEIICDRAMSVAQYNGGSYDAKEIGNRIVARLSVMPEPYTWEDLRPVWMLFDHTPGKAYTLPSGEVATALGIGADGQLLASVDGETISVLAAEAMFGAS